MWWRQQQEMPWNESQVRIRAFIADQVGLASLLEVGIDHPEDSADLVAVAFEAGLDFFGVVEDEPGSLAEVWAYFNCQQPAHLNISTETRI